jgi:hypothetical protein
MKFFLMFALSTALLAQSGQGERVPPGKPGPEGHILAQFFQLRVTGIQQSLGLPEDRARGLAERWGRWDREVMDRLRQMNQIRQQLHQVLMGAGSEEEKNAKLKPLLDQFLGLRRQQEDAKRRFEDDILVNLTPAQKARLIILVEDLQPRLRNLLREHRERGARE